MNPRWKQCFAVLALSTAVSMAAPAAPRTAAAASPSFSDTTGHWAASNIAQAAGEGWVAGYPDGRFRPEAPVTRAEFVKLLLAVQGLTPQSAAAAELRAIATVPGKPAIANSHWLQAQGWMDVALAHGLVVGADYDARGYEPDKLTNRRELMVMAGRALGLVQSARALEANPPALAYKDASTVPAWARSWVKVAADAGVVAGYPDGTIRTETNLTRAEAVVVAQRVKAKAAAGVRTGTTVQVEVGTWDSTGVHYQQLPLSVPVAFDGSTPLVPVKAVYDAATQFYTAQPNQFYTGRHGTWEWSPLRQSLVLKGYGDANVQYTAGTPAWQIFLTSFGGDQPQTAAVPARLINGTLYAAYGSFMYGCCILPPVPPAGANAAGTPRYDAATGVLVVPVRAPIDPPNPS